MIRLTGSIRLISLLLLPALSLLTGACDSSSKEGGGSVALLLAVLQSTSRATVTPGGASPPTPADSPIELNINGDYGEDYDFDGSSDMIHRIHASFHSSVGYSGTWNSETPFGNPERTVLEFDNATRTAYVDCPACWTPGISRMQWTVYNGDVYYCEIVYGKATLLDAKDDPTTANPADPTVTGSCGFSYWSKLDPL